MDLSGASGLRFRRGGFTIQVSPFLRRSERCVRPQISGGRTLEHCWSQISRILRIQISRLGSLRAPPCTVNSRQVAIINRGTSGRNRQSRLIARQSRPALLAHQSHSGSLLRLSDAAAACMRSGSAASGKHSHLVCGTSGRNRQSSIASGCADARLVARQSRRRAARP